MMKSNKKTPDVGASEAQRKNAVMSKINSFLYYITILMAITTVISAWNIMNLWNGMVTALCAVITIWQIYEIVGGMDDDGI